MAIFIGETGAAKAVAAWIRRLGALVLAMILFSALGAAAQTSGTLEVTDLAGRTVQVKRAPERVILGEGRLLYGTGILDKDNPFKRIVGWADDMILWDPGTYRQYKSKFPEAEKLPRFGSSYSGDFSAEKVLALNADLVLFSLSSFYRVTETGIVAALEKAKIPVVFIDFREDLLGNTVPSISLLGQILAKEAEANAFINFYLRESRKVTMRVGNRPDKDRTPVILERAGGYDPNKCCMTFGRANIGALLDAAAGKNWGSSRFSGLGGTINPETIFGEDPPVIIGTGADWSEGAPGSKGVPFGYETNPDAVQAALKELADRKGWPTLKAVQTKRFHSIYHQFYTSPSHVVALQVLAKWLYPDEFADVDPDATHREYHTKFSPIPLAGVFWATLK